MNQTMLWKGEGTVTGPQTRLELQIPTRGPEDPFGTYFIGKIKGISEQHSFIFERYLAIDKP